MASLTAPPSAPDDYIVLALHNVVAFFNFMFTILTRLFFYIIYYLNINIYYLYVLLLAFFVFISSLYLDFPAFYYDEVLFYNAAVGAPTDLFIYKKLFNVPILLMPYIGALKAWLYIPIFYLFETTYYSVRLPSIIIVAVSLFFLICLVHKMFGAQIAFLSAIMFIFNPNIIFHARLDWGPTSLMFLFRNLMFFCGYLYTYNRKPYFLLFAFLFAALGVFDKLNFVWLLNYFLATLFIVEYLRARKYRHYYKHFILKCVIFIQFILIIALILSHYKPIFLETAVYINFTPSVSSIFFASNLVADLLNGVGVYNMVFRPQRLHTGFEIANLAIIVLCLIFALIPQRRTYSNNYFIYIIIWLGFLIITLVQIFITPQATGPHHYATLLPVVDLLCILGLYNIFVILNSKQWYGLLISGFLLFLLLIYRSFIIYTYISSFTLITPNPYWDKYIDNTAEYILNNYPDTPVITTDWGIATNLQVATRNQVIVNDFWPWFNDGISQSQMTWLINNYSRPKSLVIRHVDGREAFINTSFNFTNFINDTRIISKLVAVITTQDGSPYIEIFLIQYKNIY